MVGVKYVDDEPFDSKIDEGKDALQDQPALPNTGIFLIRVPL